MAFDLSGSFFDPANSGNRKALLPLQIGVTSGPTPAGLTPATGLILPDQEFFERISNLPGDLYDLSDTSHLVRYLRSLLGDAGAGQLRKRQLVGRLSSALTSTHFFDLDRFYGSIFGALRVNDELFDTDPMVNPATPDEWDDISVADAKFREKIIQLAKAIEMGATKVGMISLAEAVLGGPVQIYEQWQLLDPLGRDDVGSDAQTDPDEGRSWGEVESAYANYGEMDTILWGNLSHPGTIVNTHEIWGDIQADFGELYGDIEDGTYTYGDLENVSPDTPLTPSIPYGDRCGFHLVPLKKYDDDDDEVNLINKSADIYQIQRVLRRLKPAGSMLTVDPEGLEIVSGVAIANVAAASSFWEITTQVAPTDALSALYPVSTGQGNAGVVATDAHTPPTYAWQGSQATEWHYNGDVAGVVSYMEDVNHTVIDNQDYEMVTYYDGTQVSYTATQGLMDATAAWGAINARAVTASPYADARTAVS